MFDIGPLRGEQAGEQPTVSGQAGSVALVAEGLSDAADEAHFAEAGIDRAVCVEIALSLCRFTSALCWQRSHRPLRLQHCEHIGAG